MKVIEIIAESRRNPQINTERATGHAGALEFLKNLGKDRINYGVTMTTVPKLGINPRSTYNTPIGIYFYPADYYVQVKEQGKKLEFQDDAPYIQIFEITGNFEEISSVNQNSYVYYVKALMNKADKVGELINRSPKEVIDMINQSVLTARQQAAVNSPGGHLWYTFYTLANSVSDPVKDAGEPARKRSSIVWNTLFRLVNIDGVFDEGSGIVHQNEPYQGVVFDVRNIRHVKTFDNQPVKKINIEGFENLASLPITNTDYYLIKVHEIVTKYNLSYTSTYSEVCNTIIKNVIQMLDAQPVYYGYDSEIIASVARLSDNPAIKKKLFMGHYTVKFERTKKKLEETFERLESAFSEFDWNKLTADKKQRLFRLYTDQYVLAAVPKLIKGLKRYQSDPKARTMIDSLSTLLNKINAFV